MATVTIGGHSFDTYVDLATCDIYATASAEGAAYLALDDDGRGQQIVTATRVLDRQVWQGEKTDSAQPHAFPRTGLTYADGSDVDSSTIPQQVLDACCELAIAGANGSTFVDATNLDDPTRRLKAGSVEIEYFRQRPTGRRFPLPVMELIGLWLSAAASLLLTESSGVDACSEFKRDPDFSRGF